MRILLYILNEQGVPVLEPDMDKWIAFQTTERYRFQLKEEGDGYFISTIFLGLDHGFGMSKSPILWETMIFIKEGIAMQERCAGTLEQAEAMHADVKQRFIKLPAPHIS